MTLGVSNVSRIHFVFEFIVNPDPDPIIKYPLELQKFNEIWMLNIQMLYSFKQRAEECHGIREIYRLILRQASRPTGERPREYH